MRVKSSIVCIIHRFKIISFTELKGSMKNNFGTAGAHYLILNVEFC